MPRGRRRAVLGAVLAAHTAFVVWSYWRWIAQQPVDDYTPTLFDWVLITQFFAGALIAAGAGAVLWSRQPGNRCGTALVMLGVAMALFWSFSIRPAGDELLGLIVLQCGVSLLRPILVWLLLAWPTGRLARWESAFVIAFGAVHVVSGYVILMVAAHNPLSITSMDWLALLLQAFHRFVVVTAAEIVVLVVVTRRLRAGAAPARALTLPVVVIAVLLLAGDILIWADFPFLRSWTRHSDTDALTWIGFVQVGSDTVRFSVIPLILLVAAGRRRGVRSAPLSVELGTLTENDTVSGVLARGLDDLSVRVLFPSDDGWVDSAGAITSPAPGRRVTHVERAGRVVAAIEHGAVDRPAAFEAVASTLGLLAEHSALEANTRARLRELRELRASILDAEDATRQRVERDLHDGAQQQILALALQAQAPGSMSDDQLAAEIRRVAAELIELADGVTERVVAERGLMSFLEALAAMSPVTVDLRYSAPRALDPTVAATAWFIASEAVGNAAKHASAGQVTIDVSATSDTLTVAVHDDGRGGADPAGGGLTGLAQRVGWVGGELAVRSQHGRGTSLIASMPIGAGR